MSWIPTQLGCFFFAEIWILVEKRITWSKVNFRRRKKPSLIGRLIVNRSSNFSESCRGNTVQLRSEAKPPLEDKRKAGWRRRQNEEGRLYSNRFEQFAKYNHSLTIQEEYICTSLRLREAVLSVRRCLCSSIATTQVEITSYYLFVVTCPFPPHHEVKKDSRSRSGFSRRHRLSPYSFAPRLSCFGHLPGANKKAPSIFYPSTRCPRWSRSSSHLGAHQSKALDPTAIKNAAR